MRPLSISLAALGFFSLLQSSWNSAFCLQKPYTKKENAASMHNIFIQNTQLNKAVFPN